MSEAKEGKVWEKLIIGTGDFSIDNIDNKECADEFRTDLMEIFSKDHKTNG